MSNNINVNYQEALDSISKVQEACSVLSDNFSSGRSGSIPDGANSFGGATYFSGLASFVDGLVSKGETNIAAARDYINSLQELAGASAGAGGDGVGSGGAGGLGGVLPIGSEHLGDTDPSNHMSEESWKKTVDTKEHAKDLKDSGKMSDEDYKKTVDVIETAGALLVAKKMSEDTYVETVETVEHAMKLLESGAMSEESYKKTIDEIGRAEKMLENGKMSEEEYKKTIEEVDHAMTALENKKISEEGYVKTLDTVDYAMAALENHSLSKGQYSSVIDTLDRSLTMLENGVIDEGVYTNTLDTINGLLTDLSTGKMTDSAFNSRISSIYAAFDDLANGRISLDEFNRILAGGTSSGYGQGANIEQGPDQNDNSGTGSVEARALGGSLASAKDGKGSLASAQAGLAGASADLIETLGKGFGKLVNSVTPSSSTGGVKNASAGIIAAASIAATGAAATGGGLFIKKKLSYIRFTPDDWICLEEPLRNIIVDDMRNAAFLDDEIETLKNSKFKIKTDEIMEHVKKIEEAYKNDVETEQLLKDVYSFSLYDDDGKVDKYLLFITMIIDGKNLADAFNLYNVINQNLSNPEDADFIYSGISMEDYFDEENDDDEDITFLNDPTLTNNADNFSSQNEEVRTPKDWLKDVGIEQ